jgi:hypothetical protein
MTNGYAAPRQRVHIQNYQQIDNYLQNIKFLRKEKAIETKLIGLYDTDNKGSLPGFTIGTSFVRYQLCGAIPVPRMSLYKYQADITLPPTAMP